MARSDLDTLQLTARESAVVVRVRVTPRASREGIQGVLDGALKVGLTAPPVEGAANAALVKWLAKTLGVARGAVTITAGQQSRNKTLSIAGIDPETLRCRLGDYG